ncbi:hypothetical protein MLD38_011698 [Melastoma candidum]|uniref:Uncharacterized protein n=1 Tax=Melastoma candidum TaxID=119954 RepID=A0ACB9R3I6_9MYRT|nr:hypothetical protein MLD38_011698 [Melastoma candidum]
MVVLAVTLASRAYLRHRFEVESGFGGIFGTVGARGVVQMTRFDPKMLRLAANYSADAKFGTEIEQLLQGNFGSQARYRTFATWRRVSGHRRDVTRRVSSLSGSSTVLPTTINNPRFYRYWLDFRRNLQEWSRKRRFDDVIMLDLVKLVKGQLNAYAGGSVGSDRKYKSCAVVGNSGILLERSYGELIDGHEMVIRLNNARIGGYERSVGSKTSVSFINSNILHFCTRRERCYCHPYGIDTPIVMYICQPMHLLDYTACNSTYRSPLLITDPRFDMLCARIVKYYSLKRFAEETGRNLVEWDKVHHEPEFHYSSGMQAVMLAVGICDRVSLFGFGKSNSTKHHYHTNQKAELSLHDYMAEYDLYHDLAERPQAIPFISDKFRFPPVAIYRLTLAREMGIIVHHMHLTGNTPQRHSTIPGSRLPHGSSSHVALINAQKNCSGCCNGKPHCDPSTAVAELGRGRLPD